MNVDDQGNSVLDNGIEIAGWFHQTSQDVLRDVIQHNDIKTVIEVGSFVGKSTAFFAKLVDKVYAVDPFVMWDEGKEENATAVQYGNDFYDKFLENMMNHGVLEKIVPVRTTSRKAAEEVFNTPCDLVYIDANHDYDSVKEDIQLWTPFAAKFICGDDYDAYWPGVMKAVDELYPHRMVYGNLWIAPIVGI